MTLLTWTIVYLIGGLLFGNMIRRIVDPSKVPVKMFVLLVVLWIPLIILFNLISADDLSIKLRKLKKEEPDNDTIK